MGLELSPETQRGVGRGRTGVRRLSSSLNLVFWAPPSLTLVLALGRGVWLQSLTITPEVTCCLPQTTSPPEPSFTSPSPHLSHLSPHSPAHHCLPSSIHLSPNLFHSTPVHPCTSVAPSLVLLVTLLHLDPEPCHLSAWGPPFCMPPPFPVCITWAPISHSPGSY